MKLGEIPRTTLRAEGQSGVVEVKQPETFSPRFDFLAAVSERPLAIRTISPANRRALGTRGVGKDVVIDWLETDVAAAIKDMGAEHVWLICDNRPIHDPDEIKEALHFGGAKNVDGVYQFPAYSAKYLSPLDAGIFHHFKQKVREHAPLRTENMGEIMVKEFFELSTELISSYWHKCAMMRSDDVNKDLY
jgi:hypothetical protein